MNTALTDVGPRASLVLLCCKFTRRLPENPLSLFWYPVSAAVAGDVCTCAVKANWLMEKPVLLHTGVCFFLFFFALTIFGIINTWERMNPVYYRRTKMRRLTLAPSLLCPAASSLPPSLPPSLPRHPPPTSARQRFIISLTEGLLKPIWTAHKLSCRLKCDAPHFHSLGSQACNLGASPSRCHLQIQEEAVSSLDDLHRGRARFHDVSFIGQGRN